MAGLLSRKRDYAKAAVEFHKAEEVYTKSGNQEGLCDLWLGRALTLRTQTREQDRADLERVMAVSAKTGNQYHNLAARLRMVTVYERERDYQRAIEMATEVAAEAQRDGMLVMEARATAEIGYAYAYLKKFEEAVPILRRSVEMAERAKSYGLLASNRLKLGEALAALNRSEEAVQLLEPAMQWYRQAGVDTIVPLMLIKWAPLCRAPLELRTPRRRL